MAAETRESLKPFLNKRITVRGLLDAFDDWTHNRIPSLRACIRQPELNGEVVGSHVWVVHVKHWREFQDRVGEQVKFTATVSSYHTKQGQTNYCLTNADKPEFIHLPAVKVPEPEKEVPLLNGEPLPASIVKETETAFFQLTSQSVGLVPPPTEEEDSLKQLRWVRRFVKACGGEEVASNVAAFLEMEGNAMEPAKLVKWIEALREE